MACTLFCLIHLAFQLFTINLQYSKIGDFTEPGPSGNRGPTFPRGTILGIEVVAAPI